MSEKRDINEYLYYEFGYDLHDSPSRIAEDWPFELRKVGTINLAEGMYEVFEFSADGEANFAVAGGCYPVAGMGIEELQLQYEGSAWIASLHPVDLDTSYLGDDTVPSVSKRRAAIAELAAEASGSAHILEGLYLRATGAYLALIQDQPTGTGLLVGTDIRPCTIEFPEASPWRRLSVGVGRLLRSGMLECRADSNQ